MLDLPTLGTSLTDYVTVRLQKSLENYMIYHNSYLELKIHSATNNFLISIN